MKHTRRRFRALTLLLVLMLSAAGAYGFYSVSVYGTRWASSSHNTRFITAKKNVLPGDIYDRNGVLVAGTDAEGKRVYQGDLLSRASLVHLLGDREGNVANGVESFQAMYLLGLEETLSEKITYLFHGAPIKGDTIALTADSRLSTEIVSFWRNNAATSGKCGAVTVMNYQTGEVLALISLPVYDPLNVTEAVKASAQTPFWNRATQSTIAPGSTFKIITSLCALDNLEGAEEMTFDCTGALPVGEHTITDYNDASHGSLTLAEAFKKSCNNTFAMIALQAGDKALRRTAEEFGFNDNFLFRDLVVENSTYPVKNRTDWQIAWSGAGQSTITATPLHMCMVAAAIANNGTMMEPALIGRIQGGSGAARRVFSPRVYRTACTPERAALLQKWMKSVVSGGTGTRAQVPGLTVAGKTGSAESSLNGKAVTHAWFTGYIADSDLPYACCVFVEAGGSGGSVAAPVAQKVFSYLKEHYRR